MRGLLLKLGQLIARAGEHLQAAALKGAGIVAAKRKPPARVEALPAPRWRMPTSDEVDYARACVRADERPAMNCTFICRGPAKGCQRDSIAECPDCFRVWWHDRRPSAEIIQAMERGDG